MTKRQTIELYDRLNRCNRRARRNASRVLAWLETHIWFLENPKFGDVRRVTERTMENKPHVIRIEADIAERMREDFVSAVAKAFDQLGNTTFTPSRTGCGLRLNLFRSQS